MIQFPTELDNLSNPQEADKQNSPLHTDQHANANDAIEALEKKVGINNSEDENSLDYKIAQLESTRELTANKENTTIDTSTTKYPTVNLLKTVKDIADTKPTDLKISTASKGGVLRNIDGAVGDTPITSSGWIEDEKFGWYVTSVTANASAEFDTAVTRTGEKTLKLSTTDASGSIGVSLVMANSDPLAVSELKKAIVIKPSTAYIFNLYIKTTNANAGTK